MARESRDTRRGRDNQEVESMMVCPETNWRKHGKARPASAAVLTAALLLTSPVQSQERERVEERDPVAFDAAVKHLWDSNYNRTPDGGQEQVTVASVGVRGNHDIRRQQFSGHLGAARHQHDRRDFLDATTYRAGAAWRGEWGPAFRSRLAWSRNDRLVDQADFTGRDIITFDDGKATLVFAPGNNWEFPVFVRRATQTHSNSSQEALDFEDREASAGIRYKSGRRSTVTLQLIQGERDYPNQDRERPDEVDPVADLDFDYSRAELESVWRITDKTQLQGVLGYFERDGEANDGTGGLAGIEGQWQATSKVRFISGYQFREPAVGETSDSPSEVQRLFLEAQWQVTPKVLFGTELGHARQEFDASPAHTARSEDSTRWVPLTISYQYSEALELNLDSAWRHRSSPLDERNYTSRELTVGLRMSL